MGPGSFDKITAEVQAILAEPMAKATVKIIMTHTQQLDEFYARASGESTSGRLSNYGFIFRNSEGVLRCENGFYSGEKLTLQCEAAASAALSDAIVMSKPAVMPGDTTSCDVAP